MVFDIYTGRFSDAYHLKLNFLLNRDMDLVKICVSKVTQILGEGPDILLRQNGSAILLVVVAFMS